MIPSWWRNLAKLANGNGKPSRRHRHRSARRPSFRPVCEQFEERLVPTTVSLSIPTDLIGSRGGSVLVPINVNDLLDDTSIPIAAPQQGLSGASFVLWYDPSVLSVNPSVDISLGTVGDPSIPQDGFSPSNPQGWFISQGTPVTSGNLNFSLGLQTTSPNLTGTGGGSLAVINFHVLPNAPLGPTMIDLADTVFGTNGSPATALQDGMDAQNANGAYVLNPAPQNNTGLLTTITFGGTITGGTFTLAYGPSGPFGNVVTSAPITYTTNTTTLQSSIQAALDNNPNIGPGNSVVAAINPTDVTVTFTGALGGGQFPFPPITADSSLTGTFPSIAASDTGPSGQLTFGYFGTDPTDGTVTVTGTNLPPVANNDMYSITERAVATDPSLTVAAPGVLANDISPQGSPLRSSLVAPTTHGTVLLNTDGLFVYTPNTGYLGPDSFSYQDTDGQTGLTSNIATVSLMVTPQLSIPTNLVATPGQTITVPVNIDNPNPFGSGGLAAVQLAIDYDSSKLQVVETAPTQADVLNGTVTSAANEVQTITFGGPVASGTFTLAFTNASNITATTSPIAYSTNPATLQSNIQTALNSLSTLGTTGTSPNGLVVFNSATTGTVTFQNLGFAQTFFKPMTVGNSLGGTNPTVTVATTTTGQGDWYVSANDNNVSQPGKLAIAEVNTPGFHGQLSTVGGSVVQIVFQILPGAAGGPTGIFIVPDNSPINRTAITGLSFAGQPQGQAPLTPRPPLQPYPTFVVGVDGIVTISGASHFAVSGPSNATAGTGFLFTVTAEDSANNTATGYIGTVTFTSSDSQAALPSPVTLISGVGTFSATLVTAGSQTLTATDAANTLTGTSGTIAVTAAAATHFVVSAQSTTVAGNNMLFTVVAEDQFNNTATGYVGNATFSSTDTGPSTLLPPPSPLVSGVGDFSATLTTAGNQTITATDPPNSVTGTSNTIAVTAAAATHFVVSAQSTTAAGNNMLFNVVAEDQFNNTATGYNGNATFSSTDFGASTMLPAPTMLVSGMGTLSATLTTAGNQTITATDAPNSVTGSSNTIAVTAAAATQFVVSAQSNTVAGNNMFFTVVAEDQFNNTATGYSGNATFTSTDTGSSTVLPAPSTLVSGVGDFSATLTTAGAQTITATDAPNSVTGTSNTISVTAAPASHFVVSAQSATVAGSNMLFTVVAEDQFNNTATGYSGTPTFTSTDTGASTVLPAPSALLSGVGDFSATLTTVGTQTITATDAPNSVSGTSNTITVTAAPATHFLVTATSTTIAGVPFLFTVTAETAANTTATSYTGTATFSTSDTGNRTLVWFPSPLVSGVGVFSATLTTAGNQTLTATDGSITGTSGPITVTHNQIYQFVVSAPGTAFGSVGFPFTVTAEDIYNNLDPGYPGIVKFTSSDTGAILPPHQSLVSGVGTFSATLTTLGSQTLTASDTMIHKTGTSGPIVVSGQTFSVTLTTAGTLMLTATDNNTSGTTGTIGAPTGSLAAAPAQATPLTLVPQTSPPAAQGAVVLEPAATLADPSTFPAQAAPVPASVASSASVLPVGLVDQLFADLEQMGQAVQESAFGHPGLLFSWESGDWTLGVVLDLALLQAPSAVPQPNWLSDDE